MTHVCKNKNGQFLGPLKRESKKKKQQQQCTSFANVLSYTSVKSSCRILYWELQSRWAHAGSFVTCCQVCQTKQTNSPLRLHKSDYQCWSVLNTSQFRCMCLITEHIKHQGWGRHRGRVLTREGEVIKGEQRRGWGKIRGEGVQVQKTNKERDWGRDKGGRGDSKAGIIQSMS